MNSYFSEGMQFLCLTPPRDLPLFQTSKLTHSPTQPPTQGYEVIIPSEKKTGYEAHLP